MGRLTIPDVRVDEHTTRRSVIDVAAVREHAMEFYYRLKAYEDTRFEPEEVTALGKLFDYALKESKTLTEQLTLLKHIRELAEADKDGRVIILPCKVYETDGVRVYEHTVREAIYETVGGPAFDKNAIGKSIFLTRAEAEKALRKMEVKKDGD